jgi:putative addiction module killer protein
MEVFASDDYLSWINELKDRAGRSRVLIRVDRLIHGNPGLHRNLTEGVSELKIDVGPGYRIYYSFRGGKLLLLLGGGAKSTQNKDIEKALELNRLFKDFSKLHKHGHLRILNPESWLLMTLQTISARLKRWRHILTYGLMNSRMTCLG